jgi:hypothetical protein
MRQVLAENGRGYAIDGTDLSARCQMKLHTVLSPNAEAGTIS